MRRGGFVPGQAEAAGAGTWVGGHGAARLPVCLGTGGSERGEAWIFIARETQAARPHRFIATGRPKELDVGPHRAAPAAGTAPAALAAGAAAETSGRGFHGPSAARLVRVRNPGGFPSKPSLCLLKPVSGLFVFYAPHKTNKSFSNNCF